MSDEARDKEIDVAFQQLDGALCIWARAKGEQPLPEYFRELTPNVRWLTLDGKTYQVVLTLIEDDASEAEGER
jgi:hypothetical protein